MPPAKSRNAHDDSKADAKEKDKGHGGASQSSNGKVRRQVNQGSNRGESSTTAAAGPAGTTEKGAAGAASEPISVQWNDFDRDTLHKYRREHGLSVPKAFANSYHHYVFNQAGSVGQYSPTMVRRKRQGRQTKEQLAMAVRKHFNSMGVTESDVIVDLLFSARHQGAIPPKAKAEDVQHAEAER